MRLPFVVTDVSTSVFETLPFSFVVMEDAAVFEEMPASPALASLQPASNVAARAMPHVPIVPIFISRFLSFFVFCFVESWFPVWKTPIVYHDNVKGMLKKRENSENGQNLVQPDWLLGQCGYCGDCFRMAGAVFR